MDPLTGRVVDVRLQCEKPDISGCMKEIKNQIAATELR